MYHPDGSRDGRGCYNEPVMVVEGGGWLISIQARLARFGEL